MMYEPFTSIVQTQDIADPHRLSALDHAVQLSRHGCIKATVDDIISAAERFANFLDDLPIEEAAAEVG